MIQLPQKLGAGKPIDQDWKTIDALIDVLGAITKVTSSHPQLIAVTLNEGGLLFDFSGLVAALGQ